MKVTRSGEPVLFFSNIEKIHIEQAIQQAELKTSGEIRVHLEKKVEEDIMKRAREIFEKTGMTHTKDRNGVLIFMGIRSKRFVILGDEGINKVVDKGFWDEVAGTMTGYFKDDRFAEGLMHGIQMIGDELVRFFPYEREDINELPDEISYSA